MIGALAELVWFPAIISSLVRTYRQEAAVADRLRRTGQAAPRIKVSIGSADLGSHLDTTRDSPFPCLRQLGTPTKLPFFVRESHKKQLGIVSETKELAVTSEIELNC